MKNITHNPLVYFVILYTMFTGEIMANNLGHRLGADYYSSLPENSLIVFKASIYEVFYN